MKKNILLVLLTIVLVPATFEVAAYARNEAREEAQEQTTSCCRRHKVRQPRCKTCVKACPKPACVKKAKVCKKACPFVSKCKSCAERQAERENRANNMMEEEEDNGSMMPELPKFRTE